ncbi:MAG: phospholipid carrier-dependent glycosyltransferase [Nitrospiraceae bacterium]|nr:phospholipid carrier-dependent glycosyltransferase [Nitrospiraceae bacterium]
MTSRGLKTDESVWDRRFLAFWTILLLWRIIYLLITPLDLSPDETYYWDWSRHLAWGYYSKPPMVAWIIALSTRIFGNIPFGVRIPAAILSTLGLWAIYSLGRRMFGAKAGLLAAIATAASPGFDILGLVMTIDAPLFFFWSLSIYCLWMALDEGLHKRQERICDVRWWIASGICVGLGFLSKQTMIVFWPLAMVFLIVSPRDRYLFLRPWPYISAGLSLLIVVPVIWWNYGHDWITLYHTMHHFQPNSGEYGLSLSTLFRFVSLQLLVISPVSWVLMLLAGGGCLMALRPSHHIPRSIGFLTVFSILPLAGILVLSLRQRVNANWPAPFYIAASILLAGWACGQVSCRPSLYRLRRFFGPGIVIGLGMAVLLYMVPPGLTAFGLSGGPIDPTVRLRGWRDLGQKVEKVKMGLPDQDRLFLLAKRRQTVSELAFYMPGKPEVFRWSDRREIKSQYEVWQGPGDKIGWNCLIVMDAEKELPQDLSACFNSIEPVQKIAISLGHNRKRKFNLYLGRGLKTWPTSI